MKKSLINAIILGASLLAFDVGASTEQSQAIAAAKTGKGGWDRFEATPDYARALASSRKTGVIKANLDAAYSTWALTDAAAAAPVVAAAHKPALIAAMGGGDAPGTAAAIVGDADTLRALAAAHKDQLIAAMRDDNHGTTAAAIVRDAPTLEALADAHKPALIAAMAVHNPGTTADAIVRDEPLRNQVIAALRAGRYAIATAAEVVDDENLRNQVIVELEAGHHAIGKQAAYRIFKGTLDNLHQGAGNGLWYTVARRWLLDQEEERKIFRVLITRLGFDNLQNGALPTNFTDR